MLAVPRRTAIKHAKRFFRRLPVIELSNTFPAGDLFLIDRVDSHELLAGFCRALSAFPEEQKCANQC
jgi:hypothetical protein